MAKLAGALYEPGTDVLRGRVVWVSGVAGGRGCVGEGAGETCCAGADAVEFAGDMRQVLGCRQLAYRRG
jgi:hypothetical protein